MFFKCCLFIFQKGTLWRAGKRNGHIWVKCWINILLLSFLLSCLFSFLASSSRPLETLKLWFLPSRPLPEGGWQKKNIYIYIYIVCFFSFSSTPPSDPERLLLPRDLKTLLSLRSSIYYLTRLTGQNQFDSFQPDVLIGQFD